MNRWAASAWKLPLVSGLLFGTGYYLPFLVPTLVAFIPLLYWLDRQAPATGYRALRGGMLFGFSAALIGLHFCYPMLDYSWLAGLLYLAFAGLLALRIGLCLALVQWLRRRTGLSWAILLPAVWLCTDWLQTFGDLRMTGDHLAHALAAYPFLIQFADVVGHYGVTAFALLVNTLLYESLLGRAPQARRSAAIALVVLSGLVLVYDGYSWVRASRVGETLRVGLVQPDIPLLVKHGRGTEEEQESRLAELSRQAARDGARLIVWPESARPEPLLHWLDDPRTYAMPEVQQLARETGAWFLVGVEYARVRAREDYDWFNAALLVDGDGRLDAAWAAKVYLVPFAEATPFRRLLGPLVDGRDGDWRWLAGGFVPGPATAVLDVDGTPVGVLVCYEQFFPDLARGLHNAGAEIQLVITNDAWYGRTPFQRYLSNAVRLRAIENRSSFVRVANTGISGFVDRRGVYHRQTRLFEPTAEVFEVERGWRTTIYARVGDVVVWIAGAVLVLVLWNARRATGVNPIPA